MSCLQIPMTLRNLTELFLYSVAQQLSAHFRQTQHAQDVKSQRYRPSVWEQACGQEDRASDSRLEGPGLDSQHWSTVEV